MNIVIKQAQLQDLELILSLFKEAAERLKAKGINQWQHWHSPDEPYVEWVRKGILQGEYYFTEKNEQLAGMFRLMYEDEDYWGKQDIVAGYVHSLMTKTGFEGQNIGSDVLKWVEMELLKQNITHFRLDCRADNEKLCQYYISQGFIPVRQQVMPHYAVQLFEKRL